MSHYVAIFEFLLLLGMQIRHTTPVSTGMSAQRRSSAVGALTSAINPSIDSYIEKKRAMEERARQIKEERANRKPGTHFAFFCLFTVLLGFLFMVLLIFQS